MGALRWAVVGAVFAVGLGTSQRAEAAGLSVARFGGEQGTPVTSNATALYYNPAGIAFSDGFHVFVDGTFAWRSANYSYAGAAGADPNRDGHPSNNGDAKLFNLVASPTLGLTYKLGNFAFGAAFFTPFGGSAKWGKNTTWEGNNGVPGAVDGVQRWYTIDGQITTSYVALGAAWAIVPELAIGLTGNALISRANTIRARNGTGDNNVPTEGRSWLDVKHTDMSMGFGAMLRPTGDDRLRIGLSYQSRPNFGGDLRLEGKLVNNFGGFVDENKSDLITNLPDVFRWGVSFRNKPQTFEVRLFGDYTRWSVMKQQCVVKAGEECGARLPSDAEPNGANEGGNVLQNQLRRWHDTAAVRFGASWFATEDTEWFGGVGYASNAVPSSTLEPAIMDSRTLTASAGGRFRVWKLHVTPSYTQVFYLSRDTTGQSVHQTLGSGSATRSPDSGGKYSQMVGVLGVHVDFKF